MKRINVIRTLFLSAILLVVTHPALAGGIDKGFYKKAAEKVWAIDGKGIFNPATPIPDSIARGQSAVIIARQDYFETKRQEGNTIYSASGSTHHTIVRHAVRSLVKLFDQSAIDRYSEFEIGGAVKHNDNSRGRQDKENQAFGARVHKPDGKTVDIDPSTALEVSDGKKGGKNKSFKLVIPSLEAGDCLEYFYYTEYSKERGDICGLDAEMSDSYPILNRYVTGRLDPELSAEFYSYNGAPRVRSERKDNIIHAEMGLVNIPAVSFSKFLLDERQLPFVRLNVINNYQLPGETLFIPTMARRGGVYNNVPSAAIIIEAKENIAHIAELLWKPVHPLSPIPSRALKMTRKYIKKHPGASPREIADAAYLALRYCNHTADDDESVFSPFLLSMFYNDVLERLEIFPLETTGIGIVNARDEVPTDSLSGWDQSHFVACVGDSVYMMIPGFNIAPGELPAIFQGEVGKSFTGKLRKTTKQSPVLDFKVPDRKYSGNYIKTELTVSFAKDDPTALVVQRNVRLRGSGKQYGEDLVDRAEWLRGVEKYLGLDEKPYNIHGYDEQERNSELHEALMDECAAVTGLRPDTVLSYSIEERGFLPGHDEMVYSTTNRFSGLVENLGEDIALTIGRLAGHVDKLDGSERERLLDAMLPAAFQNVHLITVKIPEGYKVDQTSIDDFNRTVANVLGVFNANAKVNEEGNLDVQCVFRVKMATVPLSGWPLLRDLYDAAARFADASIVLVKA